MVYKDFKFCFVLPHHVACRILVPQPGVESRPTAVKAPSLNHWTARKFSLIFALNLISVLCFVKEVFLGSP